VSSPALATTVGVDQPLHLAVTLQSERIPILVAIKLLHTLIWLALAGCVVAIPCAGSWNQFSWVAVLTGVVLFECAVLALNQCRCPLTDLAGRYTKAHKENFDIYLPLWLARRNKIIFGTLFVLGELFVLCRWLMARK